MSDQDTQNEINSTEDTQSEVDPKAELTLLKQRAGLMGLTFSNNISVEKLREKINAKLENEEPESDADDDNNEIDDQNGDEPEEEELFEPEPEAIAPVIEPTPPVQRDLSQLDHDGNGYPGGSLPGGNQPGQQAPSPVLPPRKLTKAEHNMALRKRLHSEAMKLVRVRINNLNPAKADLHGEIFTVANDYIGTVRKFIPYGDATENGYHIEQCLFDQLEDRKYQQIRTVKNKRTGVSLPESRWIKEFNLEVLPPLTREELDRLAIAQTAAGSLDEYS